MVRATSVAPNDMVPVRYVEKIVLFVTIAGTCFCFGWTQVQRAKYLVRGAMEPEFSHHKAFDMKYTSLSLLISVLLTYGSCKKDKTVEPLTNSSFTGTWVASSYMYLQEEILNTPDRDIYQIDKKLIVCANGDSHWFYTGNQTLTEYKMVLNPDLSGYNTLIYSIGKLDSQASANVNAPVYVPDSSKTDKTYFNWKYDKDKNELQLSNSLPYWLIIEYSTSSMKLMYGNTRLQLRR